MVDAAKLKDLLERVEAATGADRKLDAALCRYFDIPGCLEPDCSPSTLERIITRVERGEWDKDSSVPFYTAGIDTALALVERERPKGRLQLTRDPDFVGWWCRFTDEPDSVQADTPALAILAALLRSIEGGERG